MSPAQTFVREAAVAGQFYPGTKAELDATVRNFLDHAEAGQDPVPKAIIAPHAGYVYSGAVAATAYARLAPAAATIKRVVLLGPCHRVAVRGLALSGAGAFRTPLGDIPVDKDAGRTHQLASDDDRHCSVCSGGCKNDREEQGAKAPSIRLLQLPHHVHPPCQIRLKTQERVNQSKAKPCATRVVGDLRRKG